MKISKLHTYPNLQLLNEIVASPNLRAASPFYSSASLQLIDPSRVRRLSFITRLPSQYIMPTAFIENDPSVLLELLRRLGRRMKLFALPELHAKLYVSDSYVWVGSSNLTLNGFSGKQEIMIQFDGQHKAWSDVYESYRLDAVAIGLCELKKLCEWVSLGLTNVQSPTRSESHSDLGSRKTPLTLEDFIDWLGDPSQPMANVRKHLHDRVNGKNYMSGHVPPSFNGAMAFLQLNRKYIGALQGVSDQAIPQQVLDEFAAFVGRFGDQYRGSKGGRWRNYLSVRLGGAQVSGGAGDTVTKKCLVLIPAYVKARRQTQFG